MYIGIIFEWNEEDSIDLSLLNNCHIRLCVRTYNTFVYTPHQRVATLSTHLFRQPIVSHRSALMLRTSDVWLGRRHPLLVPRSQRPTLLEHTYLRNKRWMISVWMWMATTTTIMIMIWVEWVSDWKPSDDHCERQKEP